MRDFPPHAWLVRTGLLTLLGLALFRPPARGAAPGPAPANVAAELSRQWKSLEQAGEKLESRALFAFALEATAADWRPDVVERALALAVPLQDRDPQSRTYGNIRWSRSNPGVLDQNAIEFCLQRGALLRREYRDRLTPAAQATLEELIETGLEGMARHRVPVDYTNIFLMKAWNRIALGEALRRETVADGGYAMLDEWLHFTATHGITEYNSPNYYGIDLESLGLIARFAARPAGRAQAERALHLIWCNIAANWYAPAARLGGANSRCYQYLAGRGALDDALQAEGWQPSGRTPILTAYATACRWPPPPALTAPLLAQLPRTVIQRWGAEPWRRAIHYVGHAFSLGSAGTNNNSDDRALVLDLAPSPAVPQAILFMDGRGDPYGLRKTADRNQHAKALHLTPFVATVQRGPEVLQLLADDLGKPGRHRPADKFAGLWTQLPIPATAEVWFGEERATPGSAALPEDVPAGAPVFLRVGGVVAGLRFLVAEDSEGGRAPVQWIQDDPKLPATRLTVVHATGEHPGRGVTAVWLRVAEGLDEAGFAAFRRAFAAAPATVSRHGAELRLEAAGLLGPMVLEVNPGQGERLRLEGGEPDAAGALLSVNGRDWGCEILADFLPH